MTRKSPRDAHAPAKRRGAPADQPRARTKQGTFRSRARGSSPARGGSPAILFVLGAGASVDAGIPGSRELLERISCLCKKNPAWRKHDRLYCRLLSASPPDVQGTPGQLAADRPLDRRRFVPNIETLVDALRAEIAKNPSKRKPRRFLRMIQREIGRCLHLECPGLASYFGRMACISALLEAPLSVFTLNFDCGVEANAGNDLRVATGFWGIGKGNRWSPLHFLVSFLLPSINLYKMHGSTNWRVARDRKSGKKFLYSIEPSPCADHENAAIVIGFEDKEGRLSRDPYPYNYYIDLFKVFARKARQIVIVGYSFADAGINRMIRDALHLGTVEKLIVVRPGNDAENAELRNDLERLFGLAGKIAIEPIGAKQFFEELPGNTRIGERGCPEIIVGERAQ